jgi:hypothetical protein
MDMMKMLDLLTPHVLDKVEPSFSFKLCSSFWAEQKLETMRMVFRQRDCLFETLSFGVDKGLFSFSSFIGRDYVTITNDGTAILCLGEVEHPAAQVHVELAQLQDEEVGDGTTSVVSGLYKDFLHHSLRKNLRRFRSL